jgi:glutamine cyclotransferase
LRWILPLVAVVFLIASSWALRSESFFAKTEQRSGTILKSLRVDILREIPHDTEAFTQGLLWWQGRLYESTGQYGSSTLRRVHPDTGAVEQRINLEPGYFAEGLARVEDRLIQLTWQAQRAFVYHLESFKVLNTLRYEGEGWGLCHDGSRLIMSDGSDTLMFRDPHSFELIGSVPVTLRGYPQTDLNELECVDGVVYANVWESDYIVRVDVDTGRVTHQIDALGLLTSAERIGAGVLNGIAYNPETETFYITGKLWPKMFEVRFVD